VPIGATSGQPATELAPSVTGFAAATVVIGELAVGPGSGIEASLWMVAAAMTAG